jgi:hypothetical protein
VGSKASLIVLRRNLVLQVSRTVRKYISVVLNHPVYGILLLQPKLMNTNRGLCCHPTGACEGDSVSSCLVPCPKTASPKLTVLNSKKWMYPFLGTYIPCVLHRCYGGAACAQNLLLGWGFLLSGH